MLVRCTADCTLSLRDAVLLVVLCLCHMLYGGLMPVAVVKGFCEKSCCVRNILNIRYAFPNQARAISERFGVVVSFHSICLGSQIHTSEPKHSDIVDRSKSHVKAMIGTSAWQQKRQKFCEHVLLRGRVDTLSRQCHRNHRRPQHKVLAD